LEKTNSSVKQGVRGRPLVSICIPAYNVEKYISETLLSLISQTYQNLEIVIVDDGSTDNTIEKVVNIKDDRINIIKVQNGGASKARNVAFTFSAGEYILFFDADDYVSPEFIENLLSVIKHPSEISVASWGRFYGFDKRSFQLDDNILNYDCKFEEWIMKYWYYNQQTTPPGRVLMHRMVVEKAGLWNESLSLNDDFEFFSRIFLHCTCIRSAEKAMFMYRSGIAGLSSKKNRIAYESYFLSLQLSFNNITSLFIQFPTIKIACANVWQGFIHEIYPLHPDLIRLAQSEIQCLGGSNLKYNAGGLSAFLSPILGWKKIKQIKKILTRTTHT